MAYVKAEETTAQQQYMEHLMSKLQEFAGDEFDLAIAIKGVPKNSPQLTALGTRSCGGTCGSCWTCGDSCPSWC